MRIFRFKPEFRGFFTKIYAILFTFSPFWGVFAQFHALFQVFSSSSGFDMKVHSHAWMLVENWLIDRWHSCIAMEYSQSLIGYHCVRQRLIKSVQFGVYTLRIRHQKITLKRLSNTKSWENKRRRQFLCYCDKRGLFIFMYKIDKDVLFQVLKGATLAPLSNLKYSPLKMTPWSQNSKWSKTTICSCVTSWGQNLLHEIGKNHGFFTFKSESLKTARNRLGKVYIFWNGINQGIYLTLFQGHYTVCVPNIQGDTHKNTIKKRTTLTACVSIKMMQEDLRLLCSQWQKSVHMLFWMTISSLLFE